MTGHLRIRGTERDRELCLEVVGSTACLEIVDRGADGGEPGRIDVPARALVAALRAGWADEQLGATGGFEPWRGGREPYGSGRPRWADDDPDGDLGEGAPSGYHDDRVIPFPWPAPPPRPERWGQPWTAEEDATVRRVWLAAAPDADRNTLVRELADQLERTPGGVSARLGQVGCEPWRPGVALTFTGAPTGSEGSRSAAALSVVPPS